MALALSPLTTLQALPGGSLNTWVRPCLPLTILLHLYFPALKQNPRCDRMETKCMEVYISYSGASH